MADGKKTILMAEDEEELREMYALGLTGSGYAVLQAANGAEALERLEKGYGEIDMILLDIVMPVMDGFETLERIRRDGRFREKPVILLTNLDNGGDMRQAFEMGVRYYLVKSQHTPAELAGKIDLIMGVWQR